MGVDEMDTSHTTVANGDEQDAEEAGFLAVKLEESLE
jgi:hypothetical protein